MLLTLSAAIRRLHRCSRWLLFPKTQNSHVMLYNIHANCCYLRLQEAAKGLETGELTDATAALFFEQKKEQITDSLWKLNVLDIESTLSRVVDRVSCSAQRLHPRAVHPACKSIGARRDQARAVHLTIGSQKVRPASRCSKN